MNSVKRYLPILFKQTPVVLFFFVFIFFSILLKDTFLSIYTLTNIARQISIDAPIVMGQAIVLIAGGIDISVGSVMAMSAVIVISTQEYGMIPSIVFALLFGVCIGLINGFLVTKAKIVPFIATLGTMSIVRGLVLVTTDQRSIMGTIPRFEILGGGNFWIIPGPFIIAMILLFILHQFLKKTKKGRNLYALGGDPENAFLSGIPMARTKFTPYIICSLLASVSGILLASRINSANPQLGMDTALASIAAAIIGGASLLGGRGSVIGAVLGISVLGILSTGMNLMGVVTYVQIAVKAALFVTVVVIDAVIVSKRISKRRK
jgi:ribose transport system permease protein